MNKITEAKPNPLRLAITHNGPPAPNMWRTGRVTFHNCRMILDGDPIDRETLRGMLRVYKGDEQ